MKQKVTLAIDSHVLKLARMYKMNLSQTLEGAILIQRKVKKVISFQYEVEMY
jgi:post-segregation antitoxin (ccd killing protein)